MTNQIGPVMYAKRLISEKCVTFAKRADDFSKIARARASARAERKTNL